MVGLEVKRGLVQGRQHLTLADGHRLGVHHHGIGNVILFCHRAQVGSGFYGLLDFRKARFGFQVAKAGTVGDVRVVDYALTPLKPAAPKKLLVLVIALLLGLFIGAIYVVIQRALLRGIDDVGEIERELGISVLVSIPYVAEQRKIARSVTRGEHGSHVLAMMQSQNAGVEALRSLRTSLHFTMMDAANNVILLTGPAPGIGKSFIAANFGAVLAQAGKRVVVVDVDLRRGYLHDYFGLSSSPGVSDYVAGQVELDNLIRSGGIPELDFISRGASPPNPAELLMHERFSQLISQLSAKYDYVLIDSPPVLPVTDAVVLTRHADATLITVASGQTRLSQLRRAAERLGQVGAYVAGVVVNQTSKLPGYDYYAYDQYGYGRYESQSAGPAKSRISLTSLRTAEGSHQANGRAVTESGRSVGTDDGPQS